jgi:hypothetical protein
MNLEQLNKMVVQVTESNYNGNSVQINRYSSLDNAKNHVEEWKLAMLAYINRIMTDNFRMFEWSDYWNAPIEKLKNGYKWHDVFCIWEEL